MDERNLDKKYDPKNVEDRLYNEWMNNDYFHAKIDREKKPYTIVIPPPNITGQLHMGHALDNTLQDILIRVKRMQGYIALWLPGTDHASIATEAKIVEAMAKEGISKEDIGREKFLEKAWEWKKHYGGRIVEQLKKLGSSCDWKRERFTMDEGLSNAVTEVFIRLYEKELIYKGERIINWCPKCNTSISDAEVEYEEKDGALWHIKYPVKGKNICIVVATTRPETMLGDTGIAVSPDDDRYKDLIGEKVILPLMDREIEIVADNYVDKEFGTGAVKVTPAHDPNDFEIGIRHGLEQIKIMNDDATMNENAGKYKGLDRYEARKQIIEDLKQLDLLIDIKPHKHNVGTCYRCSTIIEPIISNQWFVKMKPLAEPAIEIVKSGKVAFVPDRFSKIYFNWMDNIQDWCISRQLWWGHRIPAYYCQECGNVMVQKNKPDKCVKCSSENIKQDNDTLDTWFSSALWPFSTLGWPEKTEDFNYFYPTNVLVTGYDIIFFWVARMIFSAVEHTKIEPFKHVFIHGIVRDSNGRKMSKSLGNGIDPLEIIDEYGTDALRFALTIGISPGNDLRFSSKKVESSRNFANKIWNASRFVLMNMDENTKFDKVDKSRFNIADKWIMNRMNNLIKEVTENIEKFELGIALQKIYEFIWEEFCDWYIELVKVRLYNKDEESRLEALYVLNYVLCNSMKLLHPFMPFITEEIYSHLIHADKTIMLSNWPVYNGEYCYLEDEENMSTIVAAIKCIRNIRAEMNVPPTVRSRVIFVVQDNAIENMLQKEKQFFEKLAYASEVTFLKDKSIISKNATSAIIPGVEIYIPLSELIDIDKELDRLEKEKINLEKELRRVEKKLENRDFLDKAPEKVIEVEKGKKVKYSEMYEKVMQRINQLKDM